MELCILSEIFCKSICCCDSVARETKFLQSVGSPNVGNRAVKM